MDVAVAVVAVMSVQPTSEKRTVLQESGTAADADCRPSATRAVTAYAISLFMLVSPNIPESPHGATNGPSLQEFY